MDPRVAELINEMKSPGEFDHDGFIARKDRIVALHSVVSDEADKVVLIGLYNALMGLVIRTVAANGEDTEKLENLRRGEHKFFLIKEAMVGENIDPDRMAYLTRREIAAGRMEPDDSMAELAEAGSKVLGTGGRGSTPKKGFWKKLFG